MTKVKLLVLLFCSLPLSMCLSVILTPCYLGRCASEHTIKHDSNKQQVTVSFQMEISVTVGMLDGAVSCHQSFIDILDQIRICPCPASFSFILEKLFKEIVLKLRTCLPQTFFRFEILSSSSRL